MQACYSELSSYFPLGNGLKEKAFFKDKNLYLLGTNQLVIFEFSQLWTQGNVTVNQEWFPAFLVKFLKWDSWNQITEEWVFLLFFFFWFIKNGQYSEPPGLTSDPLGDQSDCINPSCSEFRALILKAIRLSSHLKHGHT